MAPDELSSGERYWLAVREHLRQYRHDLSVAAARQYPPALRVAGTGLLAAPSWRPAAPIPLRDISLVSGTEPAVPDVETLRNRAAELLPDGYRRYSDAMRALAAPTVFENRRTYRLTGAAFDGGTPGLAFSRGRYFDSIDLGEAAAHEFAAASLGSDPVGLRAAISDPCDLRRRPVNLAISTLTLRRSRRTGRASFLLHWRDPAKVGHAGGMLQVVPVGVFQPSGEASWNEANDFSLWRCAVREFAEELGGHGEDYDSEKGPVDYDGWPFARRMTAALDAGEITAWCLGLGVDPLSYAADLLTVVVLDDEIFGELFGMSSAAGPEHNAEGVVLAARPFDSDTVSRAVRTEPMQAAGAAVLALAWAQRGVVLG
jgi:hypothetical protein